MQKIISHTDRTTSSKIDDKTNYKRCLLHDEVKRSHAELFNGRLYSQQAGKYLGEQPAKGSEHKRREFSHAIDRKVLESIFSLYLLMRYPSDSGWRRRHLQQTEPAMMQHINY